ncbi:MAG: CDP-glucose 4,6-dehydratase [Alphaproteobacteria bacterium]|nr:CDP-glucose 4,6-dehydratase [Alphaproteobacteria bacterium]
MRPTTKLATGAPTPEYWRGRRVLVTGHTGFKGAWLALWLERMGAIVTGFALPDETGGLYSGVHHWYGVTSMTGDLRNTEAVRIAVAVADPEVVIHMAAQSLVRRGYADPAATFAINVQGTVNLLEVLTGRAALRGVLVVTSDKVYRNDGAGRAFAEEDPLGGSDPYGASKAAQDIVALGWASGTFAHHAAMDVRLATARAGNVIGGGDMSADRLVPDIVRAAAEGRTLRLRRPQATRPWQFVLEPLAGYLMLAERLATAGPTPPPALNFGPDPAGERTVGWVVARAAAALAAAGGSAPAAEVDPDSGPPEAAVLAVDARLARRTIGWAPRLDSETAIDWTMAWYAGHAGGGDARDLALAQIDRYTELLAR